jgi:LacI family transcriptional regulator
VLGIGNDPRFCLSSHPRLSSIPLPWEELGETLGSLANELFVSGKIAARTIRIPPGDVIARNSTTEAATGEDSLVADVLSVLRARSHQSTNIKEILAAFPVTRRHIERRFRAAIGRSPLDELWRLRVEHAKELLVDKRLGYDEIASACGFSGSTHLHRVFAKVAGITPQEYRKTNRRRG